MNRGGLMIRRLTDLYDRLAWWIFTGRRPPA